MQTSGMKNVMRYSVTGALLVTLAAPLAAGMGGMSGMQGGGDGCTARSGSHARDMEGMHRVMNDPDLHDRWMQGIMDDPTAMDRFMNGLLGNARFMDRFLERMFAEPGARSRILDRIERDPALLRALPGGTAEQER